MCILISLEGQPKEFLRIRSNLLTNFVAPEVARVNEDVRENYPMSRRQSDVTREDGAEIRDQRLLPVGGIVRLSLAILADFGAAIGPSTGSRGSGRRHVNWF